MNKRLHSKKITQWKEKCRIRLKTPAIIKKAGQDEQQNQTRITTNINYIQKVIYN